MCDNSCNVADKSVSLELINSNVSETKNGIFENIIVGGAGCMVGWHAGVPWSIFFSNISNLAAIPVTKFSNCKNHSMKDYLYYHYSASQPSELHF